MDEFEEIGEDRSYTQVNDKMYRAHRIVVGHVGTLRNKIESLTAKVTELEGEVEGIEKKSNKNHNLMIGYRNALRKCKNYNDLGTMCEHVDDSLEILEKKYNEPLPEPPQEPPRRQK